MSAFDLKELAIDKEQEPELKIAELLDKPIMVSQLKAIVSKYLLAFTSSSAAIESSTRDTATGEA
jgi:hypothetical protein